MCVFESLAPKKLTVQEKKTTGESDKSSEGRVRPSTSSSSSALALLFGESKGAEEMRESEGKNRCEHTHTHTHTFCLSACVCVTFFLTGHGGLNHWCFHRHLKLSPLVEAAVVMVEVAGILALVHELRVQCRHQTSWTNNYTFSMNSNHFNLLTLTLQKQITHSLLFYSIKISAVHTF